MKSKWLNSLINQEFDSYDTKILINKAVGIPSPAPSDLVDEWKLSNDKRRIFARNGQKHVRFSKGTLQSQAWENKSALIGGRRFLCSSPSAVSRHTTSTETAVILINYLLFSFISLVLSEKHYRLRLFKVDLSNGPIVRQYPARYSYIIERAVIYNFPFCFLVCWLV